MNLGKGEGHISVIWSCLHKLHAPLASPNHTQMKTTVMTGKESEVVHLAHSLGQFDVLFKEKEIKHVMQQYNCGKQHFFLIFAWI